MPQWVFYSSRSGNTARLLTQAGLNGLQLMRDEALQPPASATGTTSLELSPPFVLVTPTFGDATGRGAVPKAVIRFLNHPAHRQKLVGVVGCGDRNFGPAFAQAGAIVARKCGVPLLHRVELAGTPADWQRLQAIDQQLRALTSSHGTTPASLPQLSAASPQNSVQRP